MDNKVTNINTKQRNGWMDGLKAVACLQVFFNHFMCAFYPAYFLAGDQVSHMNGWDRWILNSPLALIFDGQVYLAGFCMLSGIFMCMKIMNMSNPKDKLSAIIVGRYLRLVLPIVPIGLFVYIAGKLNWFSNITASAITESDWLAKYYTRPIGFVEMLASVIVKTPFFGDDTLSTAFWMLSQMLTGSMIAILLGMIYWRMRKKAIFIYAFTFLAFIPRHDYIPIFVLGAMFAWAINEGYMDYLRKINPSGVLATVVGTICIILSHVIGAYPLQLEPIGFYVYMNCGFNELWAVIGAALVFYGVWNIPFCQRVLSIKPMRFIGEICYDFYLIHIPILFSLSTGLFLLFNSWGMEYNLSCLIVYIITFAVIIIASYYYNKFELKACKLIENKVVGFLSDEHSDNTSKKRV